MNSGLQLELSPDKREKCNAAVLITGSARSGTTIMGKLIHSFEGVEYAFEPPLFFSLFPLIDELPKQAWCLLYETYLYEELLMGALAGRGLNCNKEDDSSIYRVKTPDQIENRLTRSWRKVDVAAKSREAVIAYKYPDAGPFLTKFLDYYPGTRIVRILREPQATINSIVRKHWFSNESIRSESVLWPNLCDGDNKAPYWVRETDIDLWMMMDEVNRAAYYYWRIVRSLASIPCAVSISYEALVSDPKRAAESIARALELSFGERTEEIVSQVRLRREVASHNIMKRISPDLQAKIERAVNRVSL